MERRNFLKMGAAVAASGAVFSATAGKTSTTATYFGLTIAPANAEMIDGTMVYVLAYFINGIEARPVLRVLEGSVITIDVTNNDDVEHGFAIPGIPTATIPMIESGATATVSFVAPTGGSYLYVDPYKAPLNRLLGLYGAFIVDPVNGATPAGSPTPYSQDQQTPQVRAVFDALGGGHPRFPGEKWKPDDPQREKIWIFSQTDPKLNARVEKGILVNPASVINTFLPRYFTINGLSGFDTAVHDSSHSDDDSPAGRIMPSGRQGPAMPDPYDECLVWPPTRRTFTAIT